MNGQRAISAPAGRHCRPPSTLTKTPCPQCRRTAVRPRWVHDERRHRDNVGRPLSDRTQWSPQSALIISVWRPPSDEIGRSAKILVTRLVARTANSHTLAGVFSCHASPPSMLRRTVSHPASGDSPTVLVDHLAVVGVDDCVTCVCRHAR